MELKELTLDNFSDQEFEAWQSFTKNWHLSGFKTDCLDPGNFKQDCVDCGDIVLLVRFEVDGEGKVQAIEIRENRIDCPDRSAAEIEALTENLVASFQKLTLPQLFFNTVIVAPIGQATRC